MESIGRVADELGEWAIFPFKLLNVITENYCSRSQLREQDLKRGANDRNPSIEQNKIDCTAAVAERLQGIAFAHVSEGCQSCLIEVRARDPSFLRFDF